MPVKDHTGFEGYSVLPIGWTTYISPTPVSQAIATDQAYSGTQSAKVVFGPSDDWKLFAERADMFARAVADQPVVVGCALRFSDLTEMDGAIIGVGSATVGTTNNYLFFVINADGSASLRGFSSYPSASSTGTLLSGTTLSAGTFASGGWYYIEVRCESIHDTTGKAQVWVNGIKVIDFTGDTRYATSGATGGTSWGPILTFSTDSSVAGSPTVWIDDFYCGDNMAVLGPVFHEALIPTSTEETEGAGSDGNSVDNHLLIDDSLGAGSDYVDLSPGDRGRYGFADRTQTGDIFAVSLIGAVANPDPGVLTGNGFVLSGATESDGSTLILSAGESINRIVGPLVTDPNTATTWTNSGVNALTAGVEVAV